MSVEDEKGYSHAPQYGDFFPSSERERLERELTQVRGELEAAKRASATICIGQPIISILAKEGQWISRDGQSLVAADGLYQRDPYLDRDAALSRVKELETEIATTPWTEYSKIIAGGGVLIDELRASNAALRSALEQISSGKVVRDLPLVHDSAEDGRYVWPERWVAITNCSDKALSATPSAPLDAVRLAMEALETVLRLGVARMYPDGPCLDKQDHNECREALTALRREFGKGGES